MVGAYRAMSAQEGPIMVEDFKAVFERDPAARGVWGYFEVVLTYAGFHAILLHRLAHALHRLHIPILPRIISQFSRLMTGVEIHPAARIGRGFFIDHGMGVVIGETAEIGDNVTFFQGVTLGGTGKESGKRHPTVGNNVTIGAGAKVLGNIHLGDNVYVGANAVVLKSVPAGCTVVGVPGRMVRCEGRRLPSVYFDHGDLPDPIVQRIEALQTELHEVETYLRFWRKNGHTEEEPEVPDSETIS